MTNTQICLFQSYYFWGPVDTKEFPHYREYVVYPMDISVLDRNVNNKVYGCTEAFLADVKWIVHNSIVFNSRKYMSYSKILFWTNASGVEKPKFWLRAGWGD